MEHFLPLLKKRNTAPALNLDEDESQRMKEITFRLDTDRQGRVYVQVVDKQGKPATPDYRLFDGEEYHVLRTLEHIRNEQQLQIPWHATTPGIYLSDYPYLVFQLLRCPNLKNGRGEPLRDSQESATTILRLDRDGEHLRPTICLQTPEGRTERPQFLTDIFVLTDRNLIYRVPSVGENYDRLDMLCTPVTEGQLPRYLSIVASCTENLSIELDDYHMNVSAEALQRVPTLVFEKMDSDGALHLRTAWMLPLPEAEFYEEYNLTYVAALTIDHRIHLQPIAPAPTTVPAPPLERLIRELAPPATLDEVYQDEEGFFILPRNVAAPLLLQGWYRLTEEYRLLGSERLGKYGIRPVTPRLSLQLGSGIDYLEGTADVMLESMRMGLKDFLDGYHSQRYLVLADGARGLVDEDYVRRLERIFRPGAEPNSVRLSFFDLPEVEPLLQEGEPNEAVQRYRGLLEGFNHLAEKRIRLPHLKAQPRSYQLEGIKWMDYLHENHLGGCLADDMGLGKTLQTIGMLTRVYPKEKKPTLLVMPKSLLFNWQNELRRFAPDLSFYTYYGTNRNLDEALTHQLVLTTYAVVRNDIETLSRPDFHYVILDESQNIKNPTSQTTRAVLSLQASHRLALSGTPMENNLMELYSLFRFLNPAMFGPAEDFNRDYVLPITRNNDPDAMQALRKKIYPFMLRRLKRDVLEELPDRTDQICYVEMEPAHAEYYEQRRRFYRQHIRNAIDKDGIQKSQFVMFRALNELRRIASVPESLTAGEITSPKLEPLMERLTEAVSGGHKVVVFFNYIAGLELVSERLNEAGIDFACMTGSTHDRKGVVERFQNNPTCKVLLMTLKTGGVGLNLTVADTVFIFEPWWNKAAEEQAVNRLHRFGQTAKVLCYSLITQNTIEEKICQLQLQKAELFEGLIGNDPSSSKHLTEEDIQFILG